MRERRRGFLLFLLFWMAWPLAAVAEGDIVRIGVVFDGQSSATEELFEQIQGEIRTLTEGEFDVRFEDHDILTGDWSEEGIQATIDTLLVDPAVDLILALGIVASQNFCCREVLQKPVIAAFVIDAELQNLPEKDGASGVENLNYLSFPSTFERDITTFQEIIPFEKLTVIFNRWFVEAVPGLAEQTRQEATRRGLRVDVVSVGDSVDEALAAIPADSDAVYVAPLLHLSDSERQRFIDGINEKYLPSFSIFGTAEVANGLLAGQRDQAFYDRLSRRIALNVQRILLGEEAGEIPVNVPDRQRLTINMKTAREIGAFPAWHLLTEADLLNEEPDYRKVLSIEEAVEIAIDANLDIEAKRREVAAGEQSIARARSVLRPQIDSSLSGVQIDSDRASSPFAVQAERTWTGGLTLTQLLYSEPALANIRIQGHAQLTREQELEQLRLDIAQETMISYMNVLLAGTLEEIRKSNLDLSRSNLELARVRRSVGTAGPGEVYRWESEVATARRDLVDARAETYQAKIALNRLMHQRIEEGYRTEDITLAELLDDPLSEPLTAEEAAQAQTPSQQLSLFRSRDQVLPYISTELHFEIFRQFMVDEGLERAPELMQLDAAIDGQKRLLTSARRAFWHPEVALQGQIDRVLERSGDGSEALDGAEDTSWSLALQATLPLYEGGARTTEVVEAEENVAALELQREALAERLELLIRSNLYLTNAAFSGIGLTQEAAEAAKKNLDLVADAYSRGAVDVLDLIDAQNASLAAELAAASALYQFFIELINVERSVNWFEFMRTPQEQAAWFTRLQTFFRRHGIEPRPGSRLRRDQE
ncbi:MAG: ABC transporter substrate binding protein [Acidobacteriota bacterium]